MRREYEGAEFSKEGKKKILIRKGKQEEETRSLLHWDEIGLNKLERKQGGFCLKMLESWAINKLG